MRCVLSTVNTVDATWYDTAEFSSMEDLLSYVSQDNETWTSLVVIVLPAKETNNEA